MPILLSNGRRTQNLPGRDIDEVTLTPLFPTGSCRKNQLPELPCNCSCCIKIKDASRMKYEEILEHNYSTLLCEIKQVRNAIAVGSLRELVETRIRTSPLLTSMLRILDLNHYRFLEERTPIMRKQPLIATTKDSLIRPEIRRFQERVIQRYEKPPCARILLLLPCSAKKPYSFSKSHKLFRERILNLDNSFVVHEVILTSPLGLVPRELELTYPASTYDTAVTGHWDEDEKKMIRNLLQQYLQKLVRKIAIAIAGLSLLILGLLYLTLAVIDVLATQIPHWAAYAVVGIIAVVIGYAALKTASK
jgi:archaeosine synthase